MQDPAHIVAIRIEERFGDRADCLIGRVSAPLEKTVEENFLMGAEFGLRKLLMVDGKPQVTSASSCLAHAHPPQSGAAVPGAWGFLCLGSSAYNAKAALQSGPTTQTMLKSIVPTHLENIECGADAVKSRIQSSSYTCRYVDCAHCLPNFLVLPGVIRALPVHTASAMTFVADLLI